MAKNGPGETGGTGCNGAPGVSGASARGETLTGEDMGLGLAEKIVKAAQSAGAHESECFLEWGTGYGVTVEGDELKRVSGGDTAGFGLRVIRDGKVGFIYSSSFADLPGAAARAVRMTNISPVRKITFPDPAGYPVVTGTYDGKIRDMEVQGAVGMMEEMMAELKETAPDARVSHGGGGFGWSGAAIANSRGAAYEEMGTGISLYVSCVLEGKGVSAASASAESNCLDVDPRAVGREAAMLALRGQGARPAEGGEMDVLFVNEAAWEMLDNTVIPAFYGADERKGRTYLHGRMGTHVAPEWFGLVDDPLMPAGLGTSASDDEGIPSRKVRLVKKGIAEEVLFDHFSALKHSEVSTSSGVRGGRLSGDRSFRQPPTTMARNICVETGAAGMRKYDDVLGEMDRGMVVMDVLGAHTANRVSGDFSVNSSRLFYVERGEMVHPVTSAMISGNALDLLGGIDAVCDDHKMMSGSMGATTAYLPSMRVKGLRIT